MPKQYDAFIGIDYGTTTCKLAYITPPIKKNIKTIPKIENVSFTIEGNETSKRYPSSVLFEVKNKINIRKGFEVTKLFKDDRKLNNLKYELVVSPKLDLGKGIFYPIAPPDFCEPQDLVYLTLNEMLTEFERTGIKRKNCKVLITVPSSFGVFQRREIIEGIKRLNIDIDGNSLIDEPNAALLGLIPSPLFSTAIKRSDSKNIILIDFGGGTCDISLLKINEDFSNEPYGVEILNLAINDYEELGGTKIDYDVASIIMSQVFHPDELKLFNDDLLKIEASDKLLDRIAKQYGQSKKEQIVMELSSHRNKKNSFFFNIANIKVVLTSVFKDPLDIKRKNRVKVSLDDFDEIIKNKINNGFINIENLVDNVISKANIGLEDIGLVILAGGSSRIFQVNKYREKLFDIFPHLNNEQFISPTDPDLLISTGAALECYNRYYLNRSLIRPICPSNIGIITAEKDSICLIPAGKGLPFPNSDDKGYEEVLYVPNTRSKKVKVPLFIERFNRWRIFETWDISLPSEINPGDKLFFNANMKLDKTLEVSARGAKDPTLRFKKIPENWLSNVVLTPREEKINTLRLKIKREKKQYDKVSFNDLSELIWLEYKAKYYSTAKKRCLSFLEANVFQSTDNAQLYNYLGLIANANYKVLEAIQFYKKAVAIVPNNSIFNYNVGVSYLWNTKDFIQAELYLTKSFELYSYSHTTLFYLAEAKSKNQKDQESKEFYRKALDRVKDEFSKNPTKEITEFFCKICDRLNLEYSKELKEHLTKPVKESEELEDKPIGLSDINQLIRSTPDYNTDESEPDEE